jgi:hypothetical protein
MVNDHITVMCVISHSVIRVIWEHISAYILMCVVNHRAVEMDLDWRNNMWLIACCNIICLSQTNLLLCIPHVCRMLQGAGLVLQLLIFPSDIGNQLIPLVEKVSEFQYLFIYDCWMCNKGLSCWEQTDMTWVLLTFMFTSAKVKKTWIYTSTPPYAVMV